jgi:XapX domain-containing protein
MKPYLISLLIGVMVGVIYGLFRVRSPAPPVIALVGLAGILLGEQAVPLVKQWLARKPVSVALVTEQLRSHSFGKLPMQSPDCGGATRSNDENG